MNTHHIQQINDAVDALPRQKHTGGAVDLLRNEHCHLHIDLATTDQLACGLNSLQLRHQMLGLADFQQLRSTADQIASGVNLLLEPLQVIEADAFSQCIQLRSSPPQTAGEDRLYYEMDLTPQLLTLCRFRYARERSTRQPVVTLLTYEMLQRLCHQLLAAVESRSAQKTPDAIR